ncbi:MAG: hypothetical protein INH34_03525 [Phycisphaerales bacterium]|nr:hypothetical protein [Phycisphaerales bacterium]
MHLIDRLRSRRRDRDAAAANRYWSELYEVAKKGEAATDAAAVELLDELARACGKSADDVAADAAAVAELRAVGASELSKREAGMPAKFAAVDRRIAAAEVALDRANAELVAARASRQVVADEASRLHQESGRVAVLRRQLVDAGCPLVMLEVRL